MTPYLVHIGYVLMLAALLSRDILWLRSILVCAQSLLATYAWHMGVHSIAWWNVLFVSINIVWVIVIVRQRRAVTLAPELARLHRKYFAALSAPEFLRVWRKGRHETLQAGSFLTHHGASPESLYFLLSGHVAVRHRHDGVTRLPAGYFVGEMSLLTGEPSTADAVADGVVKAIAWSAEEMAAIKRGDPILWAKMQSVLGHDLVEKLRTRQATGHRP